MNNIRKQASDMRVDYPIAVDRDYAVWTAFNNEYWPALYLVDTGTYSFTTISARANTSSPKE